MLKRLTLAVLGLLALLALALALNTAHNASRQLDVSSARDSPVDQVGAAARLAEAIRCQTVSSLEDPQLSAAHFRALHQHLRGAYPRVHAALKQERVGDFSLLYTWSGRDPTLLPLLLMAHQDVVPIAPGTEQDWRQAPFAGSIRDGFVWGRGAWDDKGNLIAQLEAVEALLAAGFAPARTIYLAFGADEEVGGRRGAAQIAGLLEARGVRLELVLDEGGLIAEGLVPGLDRPVALVGVAEKGFLSVALRTSATPGHSSMPPPSGESAIGRMSEALHRLDQRPFPAALRGVVREMFETLAPEMSGASRVILSNLWLFAPLVQRGLEAKPSTNAMLRTTAALTVVHAGNKDNVLPGHAEAVVNLRILPGESVASVLAQLRETVGDKVQVSALREAVEPSLVSPTQSVPYQLLSRALRESFPGTAVAPGLMVGGTDSRHFARLSRHVYRFSPVRARPEDLARFHGTNERISLENLGDLIRFYRRLLELSAR